MSYIPGQYQREQDVGLFLEQELVRIAEELNFVGDGQMHVRYREPDRPRSGLYIADGSDWDPGSGEGTYRYDESSETFVWLESGAGGGSGVDSFNTRTGAVVPIVGDYSAFYLPIADHPHTGEVTGSAALSLDVAAITNQADVVADSDDDVAIHDDSDGLLKKVNLSSITDAGYF